MDTLSLLLSRFAVTAGVFYTGRICGVHPFPGESERGHLHVIRSGVVDLIESDGRCRRIEEPMLLFLPRPERHRIVADNASGAQVLCATVQFGGSNSNNPISDSLPELVCAKLADLLGADALLSLVAQEAFEAQPGSQTAVDRLCELLIIRLLRHCLREGLTTGGTLAGLSDERLAKALAAIHRDPAREWDLEDMAAEAGMSRARFAARFREVTGQTPAHYLTGWRIALAQKSLKAGLAMKLASHEAGYASSSAFTRAFQRHVGMTPTHWLQHCAMESAQDAAHQEGEADPGRSTLPLH
jgi:AraC-like DNA-binding protein